MITFTHLEFRWFLLWFSCLWILVCVGACWVTRAIALDHAAAAEFATEERRAAGRHRLVPDDAGRPLAKPDTIPLARLKVNFATGPAVYEQPPLRELTRVPGPFIKHPAPEREPMSTRPGSYLTPEALRSAMDATWRGRTTDQIAMWEADTDRFIAAMTMRGDS